MSSGREIIRGMMKTGAGTLASRVLGLVRDMVSTYYFGTSAAMSMFAMAFTVPNLFRRLFGEGALNAAFIPVFTEQTTREHEEARRLLNVVMTVLSALLFLLMLIGWLVCAGALLSGRLPDNGRLFFFLLAILLPYLPLICLTAVQAAALNVKGHFLRVAFAPTLMNITWIAAAVCFGRHGREVGVVALAVAVTLSGVLQFAWQAQMLWRMRMGFRLAWDPAHPGLRQIVRLMGPMVVGLGVIQVNTFVDQLIAQFLVADEAANSTLYFGNHLMQFPLGVLGIALATAVFPAYARCAAARDRAGLIEAANLSARVAFFISLPCVAAIVALAEPIVRILFQHGEFTAESTARTAHVLICFGIGLWAFCGVQVLARAFYAQEDTRTPVRVAVMMVGVNLALNLALVWSLREAGLALSSSLAGMGNLALLFYYLRRRLGPIGGRAILDSALRSLLASALAGAGGYGAYTLLVGRAARFTPAHARMNELLVLLAALAVLGATFLFAAWFLRVRELGEFTRALLARRRPARSPAGDTA